MEHVSMTQRVRTGIGNADSEIVHSPYFGRDCGHGEGTLSDLGERLHVKSQNFQELDIALQPYFRRLLGSLASIHKMGFVDKSW